MEKKRAFRWFLLTYIHHDARLKKRTANNTPSLQAMIETLGQKHKETEG